MADHPARQQGAPCRLRIRHGNSIEVDRLALLEGTLELKLDLHRGAVRSTWSIADAVVQLSCAREISFRSAKPKGTNSRPGW